MTYKKMKREQADNGKLSFLLSKWVARYSPKAKISRLSLCLASVQRSERRTCAYRLRYLAKRGEVRCAWYHRNVKYVVTTSGNTYSASTVWSSTNFKSAYPQTIKQTCHKDRSVLLAGVARFELTNEGVKVPCLTAWRYPFGTWLL